MREQLKPGDRVRVPADWKCCAASPSRPCVDAGHTVIFTGLGAPGVALICGMHCRDCGIPVAVLTLEKTDSHN